MEYERDMTTSVGAGPEMLDTLKKEMGGWPKQREDFPDSAMTTHATSDRTEAN